MIRWGTNCHGTYDISERQARPRQRARYLNLSRPVVSDPSVTYIDSAVLDLTEWLCRRFQVLTGRTNVWLAVQLTNVSIIIYFVWAAIYFQAVTVPVRITVAVFCAGVLYVLTQTVFRVSIEASENNAYTRVAKGLRNPRRVRDAPLRIPFLTLSVVMVIPFQLLPAFRVPMAFLTYSLIVLTTAVLYVLGCDPLPPAKAEAREWVRGGATAPVVASDNPG
jgi:hypothetical protein